MSYLSSRRISFSGRFLSDVSTRNNFDANYAEGAPQEDLWNVSGGATVELLNCGALTTGTVETGDPTAGFVVTGAIDRPSGKMVDLDPDCQWASQLWGMRLRVADRATGALALEGRMAVCAFRDLWERQLPPVPNEQAAGARFVSVLDGLIWGPAAEGSAAIEALRAETATGRLSVAWHTFGYSYTQTDPRYRTGTVLLHLGPHADGEPETALVHRRLQGLTVGEQGAYAVAVTGAIDFAVTDDGRAVHLDVGHALRVADVDGHLPRMADLPPPANGIVQLSIGLMPDGNPELFETVAEEAAVRLFDIPDDRDWYLTTGGVVTVAIPESLAAEVETRPFALYAHLVSGERLLAARETKDGIFYRADGFVQRLDPGDEATIRIHARRFGRPFPRLSLTLTQVAPTDPSPSPTIAGLAPTDAMGVAEVRLTGTNPGNPRRALDIDGQVFTFAYSHEVRPDGQPDLTDTGLSGLDVIVVHGRDPHPVPDAPEFERDVRPILAQYAQLYPIMSRHLFDIADFEALSANRQAMLLAFGREIEDANYMPVTRDMSAGRMETLVKWLSDVPLRRDPAASGTGPLSMATAVAAPPGKAPPDAKATMALLFGREPHMPILPAELLEGRGDA